MPGTTFSECSSRGNGARGSATTIDRSVVARPYCSVLCRRAMECPTAGGGRCAPRRGTAPDKSALAAYSEQDASRLIVAEDKETSNTARDAQHFLVKNRQLFREILAKANRWTTTINVM